MPIKMPSNKERKEFIEKLEKLSGQDIQKCFQCGTCTAICPMVEDMEMHPRKIMHLAQLGLEDQLEDMNTCWICASCHGCNVSCPRGVDLPRVMEAIRLLMLRKNKNYIEPSELSEDIIKECPQIALVAGFRKLTS